MGASQARVRSVNVGGRTVVGAVRGRERTSGIDKRATDAIEVRAPGPKHGGLGSGVVGDEIVSRKHHGGDEQAVYAVAREELDHWGGVLGRQLRDGTFGENLTTDGLDVDGAVLGERWTFEGGVVLVVRGPRIPCATFAAHMGERGWVRRFAERGRTGAYLGVEVPGTIRPGERVEVGDRPAHGITVPTSFRAFMGNAVLAGRVLAARALGPAGHAELAHKLEQRPTSSD